MGLSFLFNAAGAAATAAGNTGSGATASGYDAKDLITGPRSAYWRSTSTASNSIGLTYPSDVTISHVVLARADWLLTKAGQRVKGRQYSSDGAWSDIDGFDLNPLTDAVLIGDYGQDLVVETSPGQLRGLGLSFTPASGSEASQISKLYGCNAFAFADAIPSLGVSWRDLEPGTYRTSFHGTMPYEVERQFALRFVGVPLAEFTSLLAVRNFFHWPFFIYDPDQHIWEWRLEHVLLGGIEATPISPAGNLYSLTLELLRLRHYE